MKQVSCSCGYVASGETAEELLTAVEAHIVEAHGPELSRAREAVPAAGLERKRQAAGTAGLETREERP
jgi:predicted small metal-binding protein